MASEIRDDAFDLDALVLSDLPFDAYYSEETLAPAPSVTPSPGGVQWLLWPRRWREAIRRESTPPRPAVVVPRERRIGAGGVTVAISSVCSARVRVHSGFVLTVTADGRMQARQIGLSEEELLVLLGVL